MYSEVGAMRLYEEVRATNGRGVGRLETNEEVPRRVTRGPTISTVDVSERKRCTQQKDSKCLVPKRCIGSRAVYKLSILYVQRTSTCGKISHTVVVSQCTIQGMYRSNSARLETRPVRTNTAAGTPVYQYGLMAPVEYE